jgi:hypothetical protein
MWLLEVFALRYTRTHAFRCAAKIYGVVKVLVLDDTI